MKIQYFFTVTIILTIIANSVYSQNNYYVNGNDSTASDYNSGTSPNSAWKTIKRACLTAQAGDTVIVMPSIYRETLKPRNSGNANGYITFRSEPPFGVTISGYTPLDSVALPDSTWQFETDTFWYSHNHELTNVWKRKLHDKTGGYVEAYRDNQRMPTAQSIVNGHLNISQLHQGSSYVSDSLNTLYVFLEDSINPNLYSSWYITKDIGINIKNVSYIKVQGFEVDSCANAGIQVNGCSHIEIDNNKSHHNGRAGICVNWSNSNIQIANNEVSYNGIGLGYSSGISVYRATNPSIYVIGNISHHNADSSTMRSDGNGFILDVCADGGLNGGAIFKNNVAFSNQGSGIRIHRSKDCKVINNTTFRNGSGEVSPTEMDIGDEIGEIPPDSSLVFDNIIVENNIFFARPKGNALNIRLQNYTNGNIISNYNNSYRNNANSATTLFFVKIPAHTGVLTLSQFQNLTGNDTNSFVADPLLDATLHLTSGSPCIDAGNPDDQDPDGTRLDIGAYYYHHPTGIVSDGNVPIKFTLYQNYPNPFNPVTVISYQIPVTNHVRLEILDILGREVASLVDEVQLSGVHHCKFSIHNYFLPSGVYFYRLTTGNYTETKKMILLK